MKKLIIAIIAMMVLPIVNALEISSIEAFTSQYSAMVSWQTDLKANSTVFYDVNETLNMSVSAPEYVTSHSMFIEGLERESGYFYKILSCTNESECSESEILSFATLGEDTGNLTLELDESLKDTSQSREYVIIGTATPGSVIRVYINKEAGTEPDLIEQEDGTRVFALIIDSSGTFTGTITLDSGENTVNVEAEKGLEKIVVTKTILMDSREPTLVLNQPASPTKDEIITVTGSVSEIANVSILVDNVSVDSFTIAGLFERENITLGRVSDGQEREFEIMLKAVDAAGNTAFSEPRTVKVDKKKPSIDFDTILGQTTHFTIFKIKGTTEPNAKVVAMNIGNYTTIRRYRDLSASQILFIDPTGLIVGKEIKTTADSDGKFEFRINLLPGLNNLFFNITDEAGNSKTVIKRHTLVLADAQWAVSRIDAYPQNIFWNDIRSNDFKATAYIVLDWIEGNATAPVDAQLGSVQFENRNIANNNLVKVGGIRKIKDYYDPRKAQLHALISITINQWAGSPETLFDRLSDTFIPTIGIGDRRLNVEFEKFLVLDFKIHISENHVIDNDRFTKTAIAFGKVAYAIQKPQDLAKFLTTEMINTTLNDYVEPTIKFLEKTKDATLIATGAGVLGCGLAIAYNYLAPLFGEENPWRPAVFWTCDRVLCPTVPPDCSKSLSYVSDTKFYYNLRGGIRRNVVYQTKDQVKDLIGEDKIAECEADGYEYYERVYDTIEFATGRKFIKGKDEVTGCVRKDSLKGINPDQPLGEDNPIAMSERFGERCYSSGPEKYDETRCLWRSDGEPIDPTEGVYSAFRCACLPAAYGYTRSALTVTQALKKCMQQAMVGETRAGFCERMLLIYACDIGIDIFRLILPNLAKASFKDKDSNYLTGYKDNADKLKKTLSDRYGDGLVTSRFGFSTEDIINKGCLAAATGDISIFEGALENVLRRTPVAPYGYVRGSSRQAGYDPFLGTMNINYNIYVGIVPGGVTNIELKLICDPNYEGGEFCPPEQQEILITRNLPRRIIKDQLVDKNIEIQVQAARYWFNKILLTLEYNLEDPTKPSKIKVVPGKIKRSDGLAFGCRFSAITGIVCQAISVDQFGTVELVKTGPVKTHISPDSSLSKIYYPKNKIALFTKLTTSYQNDFFLDFKIISENNEFRQEFQYMVPATNDRNGELRHYNFLVTELEAGAGTTYRSAPFILEKEHDNVSLGTDKQATKVVVSGFDSSGNERSETCFASVQTVQAPLPALCKPDEFEIKKLEIVEALEENTVVTIYKDEDGKDTINILTANLPSQSTSIPEGDYVVEVDVLRDGNSDGRGDTPIPFDTRTQKTQFRFKVRNLADCTEKPSVDIIEPIGSSIPKNNDFNIGANIMDDCNNLNTINLELRVEDGEILCDCKVIDKEKKGSYDFTGKTCEDGAIRNKCEITFKKGPVEGGVRSGKLDVAPLYSFSVTQTKFEGYENNNLEIELNAEDDIGRKQRQIKRVRIKIPREGERVISDLDEIKSNMIPGRLRVPTVGDLVNTPPLPGEGGQGSAEQHAIDEGHITGDPHPIIIHTSGHSDPIISEYINNFGAACPIMGTKIEDDSYGIVEFDKKTALVCCSFCVSSFNGYNDDKKGDIMASLEAHETFGPVNENLDEKHEHSDGEQHDEEPDEDHHPEDVIVHKHKDGTTHLHKP